MNITESNGESSCKGQENGDAHNGSERPLKKARFAWQVKGKYHLKNEISDTHIASTISSESNITNTSNETNSNSMGSEQNLEILGDYLLKQDFNTLDSVITDTNKSLLTPTSSISTENLHYPRYISSHDSNELNLSSSSNKSSEATISLPLSMVVSQSFTEDQCIARWQARQMAKGFVDNRINHVLDSWIHAPSGEETSGFLALEVAEFINNLPGANSIENEGILMAISAHGLQNTNSNRNTQISNCSSNMSSSARSLQSDDDDDVEHYDNHKSEDVSNDLEIPWSDNLKNTVPQYSLFPDSTLYQCVSESKDSNTEMEEEVDNKSHYDFVLDEAVLLAIHNKGLTTLGADYG